MVRIRLVRMDGAQLTLHPTWWQRLRGQLRGQRDTEEIVRTHMARSQRLHRLRFGVSIGPYELQVSW